jgi:dTDP-glucose pyrophosphorylase
MKDRELGVPASVVAGQTLREAMRTIERFSAAICLVIDEQGRLIGSLSDGDVRRALLAGATLDDPVDGWYRSDPATVPSGTDRAGVLDLMRALQVPQIPEVDAEGRVIRLHLLKEIVGGETLPNVAVILAGGRGTRLRSVSGEMPKPMVSVAGRPILERLVLHLVGSGLKEIHLAVGYRSEVIEAHFGDGSAFGCHIAYLHEDEGRPLGTAGPLRALLDGGLPSEPMLVLNGDLVTSFSVRDLLSAHRDTDARITVAVSDYAHEVPYGVIETDEGSRLVTGIREKPTWIGTVNAGVYALGPDVIATIPEDRAVPMTEVVGACLDRGDTVTAWPVVGDWHDVGRPQDLMRARGL